MVRTRSPITVQFPPGMILDRDSLVWVTMLPGMVLQGALILGTCEGDPRDLALVQVTVDRDAWHRDLLPPGQEAPFPVDRGFLLEVPGLDEVEWPRAGSFRITAHVRRARGAERSAEGRLLGALGPTTFQLVLMARVFEEHA